ncbi:MAG: NifB/NifX family molybdenum-iron cluster-binding protein [bacterium]
MKIAIPTENDKLCAHFGSCKLFTFIEVDETSNKIISKETKKPEGHCHEYMSPWVSENGATIVIAGGMGIPAQEMLKQQGIKVIVGAPIEEPEKLVLDYLNGALKTVSNSCSCGCSH